MRYIHCAFMFTLVLILVSMFVFSDVVSSVKKIGAADTNRALEILREIPKK